ncbi:DUF6894 family protein [Methylobacterium brachythecii]|uniref:DUF6894 domain-containing protein n=1 Tax=Methylobacterium brachythecii TaxID=1176177 RepID=A0A7W6F9D8_9HYPH|nr:hypothetical protein [Methylobacterium brachythecii]MBB3905405.1 hypothetical protein [Methylobacterium brachythecii]GLS46740.1 hypothetical protein GCM10007884_47350 [Methylobacterium brachythecii]
MPRYFFDVHHGVDLPDPDGKELDDDEAARIKAIDIAGHVLNDYGREALMKESWLLKVFHEDGRLVFQMDVAVTIGSDQLQ